MSGYSLIINPGSASCKYAVFRGKKRITAFIYQKKGEKNFTFQKHHEEKKIISLREFENSLRDLKSREGEIISQVERIAFRIVHGGNVFSQPIVAKRSLVKKLKRISTLAPLHNPFAIKILQQAERILPKAKKLLVFDTAFHHALPAINKTYALPKQITKSLGIKRYGFHGINCASLVSQMGWRLSKRTIICHLGSGCSVTALLNGKSIDTSMGYTPLEGLMMGTRAGDLDPGVLIALQKRYGAKKTEFILNKESGLKGLTGTSDMREVVHRAKKGNLEAQQAINMFCQKAAKHIAAASISLGGVDAILFSGGIGENAPSIRQKICEYLIPLGVRIHPKKNLHAKPKKKFHHFFSKVKLRYLHADEEGEMNRMLQERLKN